MKIFVNIGPTLLYGGNTGIQRVVRELEKRLDGMCVGQHQYEFGAISCGKWISALDFRKQHSSKSESRANFIDKLKFHIPQKLRSSLGRLRRIYATRCRVKSKFVKSLPAGSMLLDIDAGWIDGWKENHKLNVKRIALIYDLIPITHPQFCTHEHSKNFSKWFDSVAIHSDGVISISKSAMLSVQEYVEESFRDKKMKYAYFYLGSDFNVALPENAKSELPIRDLQKNKYFITVGSIEPRKNHKALIKAYSQYREEGGSWDLVIVGRPGWSCADIVEEFKNSSYYGKGLYWLNDVNDDLLNLLYDYSGALVIPSFIEGFGLPLIEGAFWNKIVIASDIPVFREIGGNFSNFFSPDDAGALTKLMHQADLGELHPPKATDKDSILLTWDSSAQQFVLAVEKIIEDILDVN